MDAKKGTSGEQQLASLRQRRLKGHDIHTKKHATPSQVRANHEHQQKQQQKMTTTTTTTTTATTVPNGGGAGANKSAQSNKVSIEKRIKDESGGASSGSNCKTPTSREQKQVNSSSNRARVESAGSSLDKNLEIYSQRAKEIKVQIGAALEKQAKFHEIKQLNDVSELRNSILELTNMQQDESDSIVVEDNHVNHVQANVNDKQQVRGGGPALEDAEQSHQIPDESGAVKEETRAGQDKAQLEDKPDVLLAEETEPIAEQLEELKIGARNDDRRDGKVIARTETAAPVVPVHDNNSESELQASKQQQQQQQQVASNKLHKKSKLNTNLSSSSSSSSGSSSSLATPTTAICVDDDSPPLALSNNLGFEPLAARLDPKSKFIALKSSLEKHFVKCPELLDPICKKLVHLTGQIDTLVMYNEQNQLEIQKLSSIKGKLSELCRELQRSNNQIRIESLDMIKGEQNKAKEQAGKIQSTLSGVMKLFDENQQRNLSLKQENIELQAKLKSILEHCDNWEKCVETTLKQRELENRLIKTEMARLSLMHQEEKEQFFKEKKELLQALTMMKLQQNKIEEKEAKLRSDLTNYASKYDECQEIIHKGLSKFKVESKRMLKQIEKSRQDYIHLLGKYEASNKKIKQLLEEKQSWAKSLGAANKKTDTLERLCRTLKAENDKFLHQQQRQQQEQQSVGNISLDNIKTSEPLVVQSQVITAPPIDEQTMTLQ